VALVAFIPRFRKPTPGLRQISREHERSREFRCPASSITSIGPDNVERHHMNTGPFWGPGHFDNLLAGIGSGMTLSGARPHTKSTDLESRNKCQTHSHPYRKPPIVQDVALRS
jgi:hypothetical protein